MNDKREVDAGLELSVLEVVERLFGPDARDRAWNRLGGRSIYFPKRIKPDHPLSCAIGHERALAVAAEIGGVVIETPVPYAGGWRERRDIVASGVLAGTPIWQIARECGCSERRVQQIRAELRASGALPAPKPEAVSRTPT